MPEFGIDVHPGFQAGLNVATLPGQGISFFLVKITEGSGWYRAAYHDFAAAAKQAGLLFSAYHFLRAESPGQAQAVWTQQCMGADWGVVPVMLDWETSVARTRAGVATANAYISEARRRGGKIALNYLPRWYWAEIGSPNLAEAGPVSTLALIQSSYGQNPAGSPASIYPGDASSRWTGFGGLPVSILQFGSNARIAGYSAALDINAYRGARAELARRGWFYDPTPEEPDMDPTTVVPLPENIDYPDGDPAGWQKSGATGQPTLALLLHSINARLVEIGKVSAGELARFNSLLSEVDQSEEALAEVKALLAAIQAGDPDALADKLIARLGPAAAQVFLDAMHARLAG